MEGCQHPHDDPLVIRVVVANKTMHRVLVDNGSSADIIFVSTFDKMGIGREKLEPVNAHLRGFSEERVLLGSIQLVLTLGDPPCQATTAVRFLMVDAPLAYNILLGRPSLNAIRAVPSAHHMVIKFPTANGVGMVPLRVLLQNSYISCCFWKATTTPTEFKDCSQFSMVFLRSRVLSISKIVPYSCIGCE